MQFSQSGDYNFPLSRFESMLKTNEVFFFDAQEFEEIVAHYLETGEMPLAKKAIKMGLAQHPDDTSLRLFKVETLVFENKLETANEILDRLYEIEPFNEEIYIQKANVLSKKNQHHAAIKVLKKTLEMTTDEAEIHSLMGMEYLFVENYEQAKYSFMKCLEINNTDYAALYNIVYCFDFLNQKKEAVDYLNLFLDKNPYSEIAWHQVGKLYVDLQEYEKALAAFDFAIISDEFFIGAYLERGKLLEKLKRYKEAIENYRLTLEIDDPTAFAYLRIGKCFEKLGIDRLGLEHYEKAVHEDPLLDKGWIAITDFYSKSHQYQKALYYINKAIGIDEENVLYWKRYAKINHRLKFFEEAEYGYEKTLGLGNFELETWIMRCDLLLKLGEFNKALSSLSRANEFYPRSAEIEYRYAGIYLSQNEAEKGYLHLQNGLRINAEFVIIIEELFPSILKEKEVKKLISSFSDKH